MNRQVDFSPTHGDGSLETMTEKVDNIILRGIHFILLVFLDEGRSLQQMVIFL